MKTILLGLMLLMTTFTKILVMDVEDLRKLDSSTDFKNLDHMMETRHDLKYGTCTNAAGTWTGMIDINAKVCYQGNCYLRGRNRSNGILIRCKSITYQKEPFNQSVSYWGDEDYGRW